MPRKSKKVKQKSRKSRKVRKSRKSKKCICKCSCKNCGLKPLVKCCKKCVKKRCCCIKNRRKTQKKYRRVRRKIRKMKQRGCSKLRGGYNANNMGEYFTGYKRNLYSHQGSLYPNSTQSDIPMKGGGLFSQRAIDFGLGNALTFLRDGQATFKNIGRTWNGDHHVNSADPVSPGNRFNT